MIADLKQMFRLAFYKHVHICHNNYFVYAIALNALHPCIYTLFSYPEWQYLSYNIC